MTRSLYSLTLLDCKRSFECFVDYGLYDSHKPIEDEKWLEITYVKDFYIDSDDDDDVDIFVQCVNKAVLRIEYITSIQYLGEYKQTKDGNYKKIVLKDNIND